VPIADTSLPEVPHGTLPPGQLFSACVSNADCPGAQGTVCRFGRCGCPPGMTACGPPPGFCVDLFTDPNHCGACGVACTAATACVNGTCR
jgi:hypothetical protein